MVWRLVASLAGEGRQLVINVRRLALFLLLNVSIAVPASGAIATYTLTDLGFGSPGYGIDINSYGQVVGYDSTHAYLWTPTTANGTVGSASDLGIRPDGAFGINDYGQIVGGAYFNNSNLLHAFLWTPNTPNGTAGSALDLGTLTAGTTSVANDVNNLGQVVGRSGDNVAFIWTPKSANGTSGVMTALAMPSGRTNSVAQAINASGQVAGYVNSRSFLWTPTAPNGSSGTSIDLGDLGGTTGNNNHGNGINNAGKVVGDSSVSLVHAYLWTPDTPNGSTGSMADLGALGGNLSAAFAINSLDQVVGMAADNAFVWTPGDGMVNLNSHIAPGAATSIALRYAFGINDRGQIVGYGSFDPDGPGGPIPGGTRAFLLTPAVPEPSSASFLILAACTLLCRRARGSEPYDMAKRGRISEVVSARSGDAPSVP